MHSVKIIVPARAAGTISFPVMSAAGTVPRSQRPLARLAACGVPRSVSHPFAAAFLVAVAALVLAPLVSLVVIALGGSDEDCGSISPPM